MKHHIKLVRITENSLSCSYARGYRTDNSHYYMHSSLSGLPEAFTNSEGEIVWQGQYSAWGHLQRQTRPTSTFNREQNLIMEISIQHSLFMSVK
ncbi:TPA: RHS domain-containing protein [Proteus mirabilis]|nr:RHS domain-containing protein [Proteus mirabilis]